MASELRTVSIWQDRTLSPQEQANLVTIELEQIKHGMHAIRQAVFAGDGVLSWVLGWQWWWLLYLAVVAPERRKLRDHCRRHGLRRY